MDFFFENIFRFFRKVFLVLRFFVIFYKIELKGKSVIKKINTSKLNIPSTHARNTNYYWCKSDNSINIRLTIKFYSL